MELAKDLDKLGYNFIATTGTANELREAGIDAKEVRRIGEESPNIMDLIKKE